MSEDTRVEAERITLLAMPMVKFHDDLVDTLAAAIDVVDGESVEPLRDALSELRSRAIEE